jgi:hypothetical protein
MQQFRDIARAPSGRPIPGASVTVTTAPGGGIPALYSGNGVGALASNVVSSDTNGELQFYAANGRYSALIQAAGYADTTLDVVLNDPLQLPGASTATIPLASVDQLVVYQSGVAKAVAASLVGDGGVATQNYIPFTGGATGTVVTAALQAVCDAADLVGVPVRLPGWDVRIGATITANQIIGTWGKSRLLIDGAFTYSGFASQFAVINRNFSQGYNESTAPQVRYEDFDLYLVPQAANRGCSLIGLGGVRRGRVYGLRITAVPHDDSSGNPVPVNSLLDIYCTCRNIEVLGCEFRNITGAWGSGTPIGPDGGASIWVRNLRSGVAADAETYVTQDINIHHNYFEHLTSDEVVAVFGVRGITRRVQVRHNIFKGFPTTSDRVHNTSFVSFFPLNDGSGADLGATAAVYDCDFTGNYVESACTLYELLRIGNSADADNPCYNNRSSGNFYKHLLSWHPTTGGPASWAAYGSPGTNPEDGTCGVRVIDGNVGTGYFGDASGNTSSNDTIWHRNDIYGSILGQAWSSVQSVSNPTCWGSIATGLSNCRNVNGGQVEVFSRAFYNCRSVVGTSWRVNGRTADQVAFDVDASDGAQYSMNNTNGHSQGGLVRVGALVLEASRINLYSNTANLYQNTLEPSISRVAVNYQGQGATLSLRLNEVAGGATIINGGPDRRFNLFVQATAPTAATDRDLWINTASTAVLMRWVNPSWVAASTRPGAATVLASGITEAGLDGRLNVYVMATPDSTPAEGDLQCKPFEGYAWYRYTSGAWIASTNNALGVALLSVAGIGRVRRSLNNWAGVED